VKLSCDGMNVGMIVGANLAIIFAFFAKPLEWTPQLNGGQMIIAYGYAMLMGVVVCAIAGGMIGQRLDPEGITF